MKKFVLLITALLFFSLVSAGSIANIPPGTSVEEYKKIVLEANKGSFLTFLVISEGTCEGKCGTLNLFGDCDGDTVCPSGKIASSNIWYPDSFSGPVAYTSASQYCSLPVKTYDYYNHQAICTSPQTQCTNPTTTVGEERCKNGNVIECIQGGTWDLVQNCHGLGCSNAQCLTIPPCTPSCVGKTCGDNGCGGSCGTCAGSETCVSSQCTKPTCQGCSGIEAASSGTGCTTDNRGTGEGDCEGGIGGC